MGKLRNGAWGHVTGKVGNLVGATHKGQNILKNAPKRTKEFSVNQLAQQMKFGKVNSFCSSISHLLGITFANAGDASGYSNAFGHLSRTAIGGKYPDIVINYPAVSISKGNLPTVEKAAATAEVDSVKFTWRDNSSISRANKEDRAVLVVYCPENNQAVAEVYEATRQDGTATVNVSHFAGKEVHAWMAFVSLEKNKSSDSVYLGKLTVSESNQG